MGRNNLLLVVLFAISYSAFVFFVDVDVAEGIASEMILASVFFFAFFGGFFIARQNERFTRIVDQVAAREGAFSSLYRLSGLVPAIQNEVREIIRTHYRKILDSNDWAYHEFHPSTTIKRLTEAFGKLSKQDGDRMAVSTSYEVIWGTVLDLQKIRKEVIALFNERLLPSQWFLLLVLAGILLVSFDFLRSDMVLVDILKVIFGVSVFMVLVLIKQLNELALFDKHFSRHTAHDVLRILDEEDEKHPHH
ncbi:MAG: hypothetical protein AAB923_01090 [Patescibacteria group bacterium]